MTKVKDWLVAGLVLFVGHGRQAEAPTRLSRASSRRAPPTGAPRTSCSSCSRSSTVAAVAFIAVYALDRLSHQTQWLGLALGLAFALLAARVLVIGRRLVVTEELEEPYPEPEHPGCRGREIGRSSIRAARASRASGSCGLAAGGAAGDARRWRDHARALARAGARRGELTWTPWRRGRRLVDEADVRSRRRARRRIVLHRLSGGRRPRADRARRSSSCATRGRGAARHRRLLEDLHARGLRDRAVPQADVRADSSRSRRSSARATTRRSIRCRRRQGALRAGRPSACRSCRSRSTARATCAAAGNFNGPVGPSWWGVRSGRRRRDPRRRPLRRRAHRQRTVRCARRCATSSPITGRSCSARWRSTASCCSSRPGST